MQTRRAASCSAAPVKLCHAVPADIVWLGMSSHRTQGCTHAATRPEVPPLAEVQWLPCDDNVCIQANIIRLKIQSRTISQFQQYAGELRPSAVALLDRAAAILDFNPRSCAPVLQPAAHFPAAAATRRFSVRATLLCASVHCVRARAGPSYAPLPRCLCVLAGVLAAAMLLPVDFIARSLQLLCCQLPCLLASSAAALALLPYRNACQFVCFAWPGTTYPMGTDVRRGCTLLLHTCPVAGYVIVPFIR